MKLQIRIKGLISLEPKWVNVLGSIKYMINIGNHMGLSAIWKKIARQEASNCSRRSRVQFRPVVSAFF